MLVTSRYSQVVNFVSPRYVPNERSRRMNASWVISAAAVGLCMRLIAMLYTYVCWLWTSSDTASRSPACARWTSAALGSAMPHSRLASGLLDPDGTILTWV